LALPGVLASGLLPSLPVVTEFWCVQFYRYILHTSAVMVLFQVLLSFYVVLLPSAVIVLYRFITECFHRFISFHYQVLLGRRIIKCCYRCIYQVPFKSFNIYLIPTGVLPPISSAVAAEAALVPAALAALAASADTTAVPTNALEAKRIAAVMPSSSRLPEVWI
jgi:hypothetical protein